MEERLAVIADDFTGAADSGVQFAEAGRACALVTSLAEVAPVSKWAEVIAVDAESRALSPSNAAEAVRAAIEGLRSAGYTRIFKKVDSTLRGNLGSEIEAAMQAARCELAIVAPSAPRNGRSVVDGLCLIGGAPLGESEYARGIVGGPTSSASAVIARQSALPIASLYLAEVKRGEQSLVLGIERAHARGAAVVVVDAETIEDLEVVARATTRLALRNPTLLVGSSGLAEAIARITPRPPAPEPPFPLRGPELGLGPALFVVGSRSEVARRQVGKLLSAGRLIEAIVDPEAALASPGEELRRLEAEIAGRGLGGSLLVWVATAGPTSGPGADRTAPSSSADPHLAARESSIAALLGSIAARAFEKVRPRLIVVTGGDTAASVVRSLGVGALRLERELFPGVVLSTAAGRDPPNPIAIVTKAGGFGDEETLLRVYRWWMGTH